MKIVRWASGLVAAGNRSRALGVGALCCSVALAGGSLVSAGANAEETGEAPKLTATGHLPGDSAHGVQLAEDATYVNEDGKTVTHPCAGRKLGYHGHFDYLYGTRDYSENKDGTLSVMAVDGQTVIAQDKICFRLPQEGDRKGNELSRINIPANTDVLDYSFLGEEGDIVWLAPQDLNWDSWRPIWAGLGAFDTHHEAPGNVPTDFENDKMHFDLVDFEGPGEVNVYAARWNGIDRLFSTSDEKYKSFGYGVGGHGHWSTTFSKPGIYKLTFVGRAVKKDGSVEKTEPTTAYWLVGTDADVHLPEGTTTDLREITEYVQPKNVKPGQPDAETAPEAEGDAQQPDADAQQPETQPDAEGAPENEAEPGTNADSDNGAQGETPSAPEENEDAEAPADTENTENSESAGPGAESEDAESTDKTEPSESQQPETEPAPESPQANPSPAASEELVSALRSKPSQFVEKGHVDLALHKNSDGEFETKIAVDERAEDGGFVTNHYGSGDVAFVVSDEMKNQLGASQDALKKSLSIDSDTLWVLPQTQDPRAPWPGFSSEALGSGWSKDGKGGTVSLKTVEGPGNVVAWHDVFGGSEVLFHSSVDTDTYLLPELAHDHVNWGFTEPGAYRLVFSYDGTDANGEDFSVPLEIVFLVGDDTIEQARALKDAGYVAAPQEDAQQPEAGDESAQPEADAPQAKPEAEAPEADGAKPTESKPVAPAETGGQQSAGTNTEAGGTEADNAAANAGNNSGNAPASKPQSWIAGIFGFAWLNGSTPQSAAPVESPAAPAGIMGWFSGLFGFFFGLFNLFAGFFAGLSWF